MSTISLGMSTPLVLARTAIFPERLVRFTKKPSPSVINPYCWRLGTGARRQPPCFRYLFARYRLFRGMQEFASTRSYSIWLTWGSWSKASGMRGITGSTQPAQGNGFWLTNCLRQVSIVPQTIRFYKVPGWTAAFVAFRCEPVSVLGRLENTMVTL